MENFQTYFSHYLKHNKNRLHFCAHSHHPWPDVSFEAQKEVWEKSSLLLDRKWNDYYPDLKSKAEHLLKNLVGAAESSCGVEFASNTHELTFRIFSTFRLPSAEKPWKIVCTDSEFHSFSRQMARLQEEHLVELKVVKTFPFETFEQRFCDAVENSQGFDGVFLSHVFFNSGYVVKNVSAIWNSCKSANIKICVVDGYHSIGAIPVGLGTLTEDIFYLGGSYKYLQSGEGCCFAFVPKSFFEARPIYTGWFASFGSLSKQQNSSLVPYAHGASAFAGSTLDYSAMARLVSVLELWLQKNISVEKVCEHTSFLQNLFLEKLGASGFMLNQQQLVVSNFQDLQMQLRARFVTFDLPNAQLIYEHLLSQNCDVDVRGTRLRIGFGMYHSVQCVERLLKLLANL